MEYKTTSNNTRESVPEGACAYVDERLRCSGVMSFSASAFRLRKLRPSEIKYTGIIHNSCDNASKRASI